MARRPCPLERLHLPVRTGRHRSHRLRTGRRGCGCCRSESGIPRRARVCRSVLSKYPSSRD